MVERLQSSSHLDAPGIVTTRELSWFAASLFIAQATMAIGCLSAATSSASAEPAAIAPQATAGAPQATAGAPQPTSFAVYQPAVGVDPYPDAPSGEGWSVRFGSDGRPTHGRLFDDCQPGGQAEAAFLAAGPPEPSLPHAALLLFEDAELDPPRPGCRTLRTTAVWKQPILTAADVASCAVTDRQRVEIDLDRGGRVVIRQVVVRMDWNPGGLAKLAGLGLGPSSRLLPATGVESLGEWFPAGSGEVSPFAEFKVRGEDEAEQGRSAQALCAFVNARP